MEILSKISQNINLIIVAIFLCSSCKTKDKVEYKYIDRNGQKSFGKFINGLEDSIFIFKDEKGNISSYEVYSNGKASLQIFYFTNGDTMAYADNNIFKAYYENNKIETIQKSELIEGKPVGIFFDSLGQLSNLNSDLKFLKRGDSLRLSIDYPDWQEQVKEWKLRENELNP